jgi:undecaprenyl-diphosphatase
LLGALHGLTDVLPVSSSGHLALAQLLFDLDPGGLVVSVVMQVGTLLATVVFLRGDLGRILTDCWNVATRRTPWSSAPGAHDVAFVAAASLPTAVIGLALRDSVEVWLHMPWVLGVGFMTTALLLLSTRWVAMPTRVGATFGLALLLGFAQGVAVLPGVSRSGATITLALWLGFPPARAFELSMLMSVPVVLGTSLLQARELTELGEGGFALAGGALTAFAVGYAALVLLRGLVMRGKLPLFALWVLPVAVATLGLAWAWPVG